MLALLVVAPADACDLPPPHELELAPDPLDDTPPTPPVVAEVFVTRGHLPRSGVVGACEELGQVTLRLARPSGDPDDVDDVGYLVELVEGDAPFDSWPTGPVLGPEPRFTWIDDHQRDQAPLAFTLSLTPVDRAGNEGEPVTVVVEDRGRGCDVAGGSPLGAAAGVAWLLTRRARTRSGRRS